MNANVNKTHSGRPERLLLWPPPRPFVWVQLAADRHDPLVIKANHPEWVARPESTGQAIIPEVGRESTEPGK